MFIPDEMKNINQFMDVAIPSNKSYFSRIGEIQLPASQFTGEEVAAPNLDKISQMERDYEAFANDPQFQTEENNG